MKEATLNQLSVTFDKTRNAMPFALQMFCQTKLNKSGSLRSGTDLLHQSCTSRVMWRRLQL